MVAFAMVRINALVVVSLIPGVQRSGHFGGLLES